MENLFTQTILSATAVFGDHYIDKNILYLQCFHALPCEDYIGHIDGKQLHEEIKKIYAPLIKNEYVYRWYQRKKKDFEFDKILLVLSNQIILDIDESYCKILHNGNSSAFISGLIALCHKCREKQRREPLDINLIVQNGASFDLKPMEIKRTKLDIDLYYEDDFKDVDDTVRKRLNKKQDKGIVLLHGLPGTGKTTYLRYLIGKIKKKILFLSPGVAGNLMNPEFMNLLIENPNCVIVIEDAENIIMDRKSNNSSSVSNLLNISDGLLSDFLNVQLVCTFNSSITLIDEALMRKGRLIARYEFGKLGVKKAQRLSDHLGFAKQVTEPMTIAEITNPNERTYQSKQVKVIGFRRA